MLQRIFVATDFSPAAGRAAARAALICRKSGGQLTVLHALPERALFDRLFQRHEVDYEAIVSGATHALRGTLDELERTHGIKASSALLSGAAHLIIAAAAPASKADLVVMGTLGEGESGGDSTRLGGTALKSFLHTDVPLLLVRRPAREDYDKVLAAVDGSESARSVLAAALAVSGEYAICEVLHAFDIPFAARLRAQKVKEATIEAYGAKEREGWERELAALTSELRAVGRVRSIVVRGGSAPEIMQEIGARQPDLVVVGRRARHARVADAESIDGVSLAAVLNAPSDVLVIP